jgi:hypothetical protein
MAPTTCRERAHGIVTVEDVGNAADALTRDGYVHLQVPWPEWTEARRDALRITSRAGALDPIGQGLPELNVVGEFTAPPPASVRRPYQPLHIDFGLPLAPRTPVDIVRFTVLHIDGSQKSSGAATRVVDLGALLSQRDWPAREVIAKRLRASADSERPVEGILGRIIESVDEGTSLPATASVLCGMEFATLAEERSYFHSHGMDLAVEHRIVLRQQEALLIDNLRTAHGRIGRRRTKELHQLFVGYRSLTHDAQRLLLDWVLAAFE